MNNSNCCFIMSTPNEISGRFFEIEDKKPQSPEKQCESAESEKKVTPTHIVSSDTSTWGSNWRAREVGDERPRNLLCQIK